MGGDSVVAPDPPRLKVVDSSYDPVLHGWKESYHLLEEPDPPIDWVIHRLIAAGTLNLLTGGPKAFKTWLLHSIMVSCAMGGKLLGQFDCKKCRVMFVQAEESDRQHRRKYRWTVAGAELPVEEAATLPILTRVARLKFTEPKDREEFRRAFEVWRPNLVLVDSLRRTHDIDEKDQAIAQHLKDGVDEYLRLFPECAWIVNHHTRKVSGDKDRDTARQMVSGHGDLIAVVDGHLALSRDTKTKVITLTHDACRDDEELQPFYMRFQAREGKAWFQWLGYADQSKPGDPTKALVLALVKVSNRWMKSREIIDESGLPEKKVRDALGELTDDGDLLKRPAGGSDRSHEYRAPEVGE